MSPKDTETSAGCTKPPKATSNGESSLEEKPKSKVEDTAVLPKDDQRATAAKAPLSPQDEETYLVVEGNSNIDKQPAPGNDAANDSDASNAINSQFEKFERFNRSSMRASNELHGQLADLQKLVLALQQKLDVADEALVPESTSNSGEPDQDGESTSNSEEPDQSGQSTNKSEPDQPGKSTSKNSDGPAQDATTNDSGKRASSAKNEAGKSASTSKARGKSAPGTDAAAQSRSAAAIKAATAPSQLSILLDMNGMPIIQALQYIQGALSNVKTPDGSLAESLYQLSAAASHCPLVERLMYLPQTINAFTPRDRLFITEVVGFVKDLVDPLDSYGFTSAGTTLYGLMRHYEYLLRAESHYVLSGFTPHARRSNMNLSKYLVEVEYFLATTHFIFRHTPVTRDTMGMILGDILEAHKQHYAHLVVHKVNMVKQLLGNSRTITLRDAFSSLCTSYPSMLLAQKDERPMSYRVVMRSR